ncbi:Zn-dependent hydrolase [Solirubrobacter sp. CPCC 204708]|uniref:Zn-dependent hydrolase n=1 Tax=Solirubrobacter deserti TaxID=2282478 RepID=A0ABT4RNZ2_9ACTN|nr:Zn-dependent hydrolase [Solirubrobacter deserti]MBE2319231.1 Zn-dependent hydrolase [Solirubrobacter deserti]MDA0140237.1 Zn-dependent hydrolase [Solirubrobacter deserti]
MPSYDWERPLRDLRELADLTGGPDGARRLAWSEDWRAAREWLLGKLAETDATVKRDVAGNLWATVPGESERIVVVGSHIDAVPNGGWLDGCLGVCAALEVLRAHTGETPQVTLKLVDWADEEGARFGRSLLGSSAAAGTLVPDEVRRLKDAQGTSLPDALAENGIDLDTMGEAELPEIAAYLELHIEQGPRLEESGKPAAAVIGCFGVERHSITFTGKASHAGSTPMNLRHDAFLAAARFGLAARESAIERGGVATIGTVTAEPGIPTIINQRCEVTLDQRAFTPEQLRDMLADVQKAAEEIAAEEGVTAEWKRIWQIDPIPFDGRLVDLAAQAVGEITGDQDPPRLPSGALHDAAEVARRYPTVMVFSSSIDGVSHNPAEDTREDDLRVALQAYGRLYDLTAGMISEP